ncbi:MAG: hypothetical protein KKG59_01440 [Nanoarchaeota archaeon]|nr:hypothetical protein [Nanoarchaeota archaeon]
MSKIIRASEIGEYRDQGYKVIDPHLHSSASYDVFPIPALAPRNLAAKLLRSGWDMVTFTDHDTRAAYDDLGDLEGVVRGAEITIRPKKLWDYARPHTMHVNIWEYSDDEFDSVDAISRTGDFFGMLDFIRSAKLPHQLNHPTIPGFFERPDWSYLPAIAKEFEVVEAYNHRRSKKHNEASLSLANAFGLGTTSGSDNHIGLPVRGTLVKGDSFPEMWDRIKAGDSLIVQGGLTYDSMKQTIQEYVRHFFRISPEDLKEYRFRLKSERARMDKFMDTVITKKTEGSVLLRGYQSKLVEAVFHYVGPIIAEFAYVRKQNKIGEEIFTFLDGLLQEMELSYVQSGQGE